MEPLHGTLLTSDQVSINYRFFKQGRDNVILIAHGFYTSVENVLIESLARDLTDKYDVLLFDFRGHGRSTGQFLWTASEVRDIETVIKEIRPFYRKVGVIGFSLGAAISLLAGEKHPDSVDSIVAVSGPSDFNRIDFHFWRINIETDILYNMFGEGRIGKGVRPGPFWVPKIKPADIVGGIKAPILYLHGDHDWLIRPWHSKKLYANTRSHRKLKIIPRGLHAEFLIRNHRDEFTVSIRDWFPETLLSD